MTTNVFSSFAAYAEQAGLAPDAVAAAFRQDPAARELLARLETGELGVDGFEQGFAALLGVPAEGLISGLMKQVEVEPRMVETVRAARRAGVRTGLISNSWGPTGYSEDLLAELFDGVVISGRVGLRKPDPAIYRLGAELIGLPPSRCVFVDDLRGNLRPARELGMLVVQHEAPDRTAAELGALLGFDPHGAIASEGRTS
jgi:epoxide hydrolase-like predicted phosphatase